MPPEQVWLGLERYWRTRASAADTARPLLRRARRVRNVRSNRQPGVHRGPPTRLRSPPMTKRIALTATIFAALALAVAALRRDQVYKNVFKSRDDYRSVSQASGKKKKCKRQLAQEVGARRHRQGRRAELRALDPGRGRLEQPDQIVQAIAKSRQEHRQDGPQGRLRRRLGPRRPQGRLRVPGLPEDAALPARQEGECARAGQEKAIEGLDEEEPRSRSAPIGNTIVGKVNGKRWSPSQGQGSRAGQGQQDRSRLRHQQEVEEGRGASASSTSSRSRSRPLRS